MPELKSEADAIAKYYQPKVDDLDQRIAAIIKHGQGVAVSPTTPGLGEAGALLKGAGEKVRELHKIVDTNDASSIEHQAETLAKANDAIGLEKLIDESRDKLQETTTVVDDHLESVESWLALAQARAPVTPPAP